MLHSRDSIGWRVFIYVMFIAVVAMLIISSIRYALEYRATQEQLNDYLKQTSAKLLPPLTKAVWRANNDMVQTILDSIVGQGPIVWAGVAEDNTFTAEAGKRLKENERIESFPLLQDETREIGLLIVTLDMSDIYNDVRNESYIFLLIQCIEVMCVALAMLFIFNKMVTKPLRFMAKQAQNLNIESPLDFFPSNPTGLHGGERNELGILAQAVNNALREARIAYGEAKRSSASLVQAVDDLKKEIKKRHHAEEEQARFQQLLVSVFYALHETIHVIDNSMHLVMTNSMEHSNLIGKAIPAYEAHDHKRPLTNPFGLACDIALVCHAGLEMRLEDVQFPDGSIRNCHAYPVLSPSGETMLVIEHQQDITASQRMQEALARSEERLTLALDSIKEGVWDWNINTDTTFWSPRIFELAGYNEYEVVPKRENWRSRIHHDDQDHVEHILSQSLVKDDVFEIEYRFFPRSGPLKWLLERGKVVERNTNGSAKRMIGTITDVTMRKSVQEALRISEERLTFALKAASDGLWDWEIPESTFYFSPRLYTMLNYEPYSFPASYSAWIELIHEEDREQTIMTIRETIDTAGTFKIEHRMKTRDGNYLWILNRGIAVKQNQLGRATRLVGTHTDISELKESERRLRASEERLNLILSNLPDAMFILGRDGIVLYANPASGKFFGKPPSEMLGEPFDIPNFAETDFRELNFVFPDNHHGVVEMNRIELSWRDDAVWIISLHDVTDRILAEEAILAKQVAEEANLAKSEFLASMSHELRTPLTGIIGQAQTLERFAVRGRLEQDRLLKSLGSIVTSGRHLATIISDIMDISRIEAGQFEIHPEVFPLTGIFSDIISTFESAAQTKGIEFRIDLPPDPMHVFADRQRLTQVLVNLVSNAIKYTEQGYIHLSASLDETEQYASIEVQDTGVGIGEEDKERIFGRFVRLQKTKHKQGVGLGLSICRRLIDLMDGSISLESELDKGSTFIVTLPATKENPHE